MTDAYPARERIERTWAAPLSLVWELWTTPAGFCEWYGPVGFRCDIEAFDATPGGAIRYRMVAVGAEQRAFIERAGRPTSWENAGRFTAAVPRTHLAFELVAPAGPGRVITMVHTVDLVESPDGVRMVLTIGASSDAMLRPAAGGWRSAFGKMEAALGDRLASTRK